MFQDKCILSATEAVVGFTRPATCFKASADRTPSETPVSASSSGIGGPNFSISPPLSMPRCSIISSRLAPRFQRSFQVHENLPPCYPKRFRTTPTLLPPRLNHHPQPHPPPA